MYEQARRNFEPYTLNLELCVAAHPVSGERAPLSAIASATADRGPHQKRPAIYLPWDWK
jgi:hypothetical protein